MKEKWGITSLLSTILLILSFFVYRELPHTESREKALPKRFDYVLNATPGTAAVSLPYNIAGSTDAVSGAAADREIRIAAAIAKYGSRPVVLEFMEDLKKDPCSAKAMEDEKTQDMISALSAARRAGCLDKLKARYAFKPRFLELMAEVMTDPEVRPLLESASAETPAAAPADTPAGAEPAKPAAP